MQKMLEEGLDRDKLWIHDTAEEASSLPLPALVLLMLPKRRHQCLPLPLLPACASQAAEPEWAVHPAGTAGCAAAHS